MGLPIQNSTNAELHQLVVSEKFDDLFKDFFNYFDSLERPSLQDQTITLIARSLESYPARAILRHAVELAARGISLSVILAEVETGEILEDFVEGAAALCGPVELRDCYRWAKNAALLDAHEQLILGMRHSWSGDSMRRMPGQRNALSIIKKDDPIAVTSGASAFSAIWSCCQFVPRSYFRVNQPRGGQNLSHVLRFDALGSLGVEMDGLDLAPMATRH